MASVMAKHFLAETGMSGHVRILSAGTGALFGTKASEPAVLVMKEKGISLTSHLSAPLTGALVAEADLILTMTVGHRRHIEANWPEAAHKTHRLTEYVGRGEDGPDVPDPYGSSVDEYLRCAARLWILVSAALEKYLGFLHYPSTGLS